MFLSLNTGFRAPNIDDSGTLGVVDFRYETPNFSLKPENSLQYQLGYKVLTEKLRAEIYVYRNELYNLIVRNRIEGDSIDGYPVYTKENVERAYIQGVESSVLYQISDKLSVSGNVSYTFGQNITKNEPARRIPPVFGRVSSEYRVKQWWCAVEIQAASKQTRLAKGDKEDNRIPLGGTPGWRILNLHTGYSYRFVSVDLSFRNLTNEDYRYHGSGVNGYGRSAFLTVSVRI
ncbi:MAG: TonB-dependent receptor [Bacteroidetes bacterium]|nr:TonB-dependent receptor [Bacteroidota bacterium]